MAQVTASEVSRFLSECLKKKGLNVRKVVLFWSHAKGLAGEDSDIDIVIVSEDFRRKDIFKRAERTKKAEIKTIKKFMVPLDIIVMTPEEYENGTSAVAAYAKDGEVIYSLS